jgi:transcription elongation GreA/GreB family factor
MERVTDQQYAILGGHLRHLPGGVDEYLRLRARQEEAPAAVAQAATAPGLTGADRRAAQKEFQAVERRLEKLTAQVDAARTALADHDQSDYVGLGEKMRAIGETDAEIAALEERWLELSTLLD